jgi:hypothetical protein
LLLHVLRTPFGFCSKPQALGLLQRLSFAQKYPASCMRPILEKVQHS